MRAIRVCALTRCREPAATFLRIIEGMEGMTVLSIQLPQERITNLLVVCLPTEGHLRLQCGRVDGRRALRGDGRGQAPPSSSPGSAGSSQGARVHRPGDGSASAEQARLVAHGRPIPGARPLPRSVRRGGAVGGGRRQLDRGRGYVSEPARSADEDPFPARSTVVAIASCAAAVVAFIGMMVAIQSRSRSRTIRYSSSRAGAESR